jgi:hypothetical protein
MNEDNSPTGLEAKQAKAKEEVVEQLRKIPIIQAAVERCGISRATFYRYKKDDKEFADAVNEAIETGAQLVSDVAESKLISAIKGDNLTATMFWLKNRHQSYSNRLEVNANIKTLREELNPEQQKIVNEALRLLSLTGEEAGAEGETLQ